MTHEDYNGWTNKQTWNINLTYGEVFRTMGEEQEYDDLEHMADSFEQLVNELEFEGLRSCSLAHQAVGEYLDRVNWEEIAQHIADDLDLFKDEEDSEEDLEALREILAEAKNEVALSTASL
jgi:UDP-N-acetylmuramate-alanine ligase